MFPFQPPEFLGGSKGNIGKKFWVGDYIFLHTDRQATKEVTNRDSSFRFVKSGLSRYAQIWDALRDLVPFAQF